MKAHLIYSMVAVGMLFASCANEELPISICWDYNNK